MTVYNKQLTENSLVLLLSSPPFFQLYFVVPTCKAVLKDQFTKK